MESKVFIGITTFRKEPAIRRMLETLIEHGYATGNIVHVADDGEGKGFADQNSTVDIIKDYPGVGLSYGKHRLGISANKNRLIKEFLTTDCSHILLLDDDQEFIRPGMLEDLIETLKRNNLNHITGKWSSSEPELEQLTGGGWSSVFPIQAEGYHLTWHENGSHGCSHFYTRKAIEEAGYWHVMKEKYGYDHALHTSLVMRVVDKRAPAWHPQFTHSGRYLIGQNVPNNYTIENVHANSEEWKQMLQKVWDGTLLKVTNSGLKDKDETVIKGNQ